MKLLELFQNLFEDLTENTINKILKNTGLVSKIAGAAQEDTQYSREVLPYMFGRQPQQPGIDADKVISRDVLQRIAKADPEEPKNLEWLAAKYAARQFRIEDISSIKQAIELFFRVRDQLPQKNLYAITSIGQLYELLEPYSRSSQERLDLNDIVNKVKATGGKVLFDDGTVVVMTLANFRSSVIFADITKWCTTQKKNWDYYTSQGPLYVVATTSPKGMEFWQFHYKNNDDIEFKNKNDVDITAKDIARLSTSRAYTDFLNYMIKLHYSKYFNNET